MRRRTTVEKVVAEPVSHEIVDELRNELVVLNALSDVSNRDEVGTLFKDLTVLSYCPRIMVINNKRALLEFKGSEERDNVLKLNEITHIGIRISLSRWSPGNDTLSSNWFKLENRWITLLGIPYHLRSFEVLDSLCKRFGKVDEIARCGLAIDDLSGTRVKISQCDVKQIPPFIPLVDLGGMVYPIRILLDVNDNVEVEGSSFPFHAKTVGVFGGRRRKSNVKMASSDRVGKSSRFVWQSTESVPEMQLNRSRVSNSLVSESRTPSLATVRVPDKTMNVSIERLSQTKQSESLDGSVGVPSLVRGNRQ